MNIKYAVTFLYHQRYQVIVRLGFPALTFLQLCMPTIVSFLIAVNMQATFATLTKVKTKSWINIHTVLKT